jgi:hypothetical protein
MTVEACADGARPASPLIITPPQASPPPQPKRKRDEDPPLAALTWETFFDPAQRARVAVVRTTQSCVRDAMLWRSHLVSHKIQTLRDKVDERTLCLAADLCAETLVAVPESADWKLHVDCVLSLCDKLVSGHDRDSDVVPPQPAKHELDTWALYQYNLNRHTAYDVISFVGRNVTFTMFENRLLVHVLIQSVSHIRYSKYDPCYLGLAIALFVIFNTRAEHKISLPKKHVDQIQLEMHMAFVLNHVEDISDKVFCKSLHAFMRQMIFV